MANKTILTDHYNNLKAEHEYLRSKPACILVTGKQCSGKTTIANFLSNYWEAPLINGESVINELLKSKPKTKDVFIMEEMLLRGEMISSTLVFDQMLKKLMSPDVMNRGYVLDDFPNVETNLMSIKYQFDTLNKLNLTPDFLIYIKMPHDDMVMRANNLRIDPLTKDLVNLNDLKIQQQAQITKKEENKMIVETLQLKKKVKKEIKKSYVIKPEMEQFNFKQNLEEFNCKFLPRLENYIDRFNHQKVIELDGNMPIDKLIADLKERLHYFRIQPAIKPIRLNVEAAEAELEQERIAEEERLQLIIAKRKAHTQEMLARLEASKRRLDEQEEEEEEENNSREDGKESVSADSVVSLTGSVAEKTASIEGSKQEEEVEQQQQQQQINPYYREEECCPEEIIRLDNKDKKKPKQKANNKDNNTIDEEEENDLEEEMDFLEQDQIELINLDMEPVETLDEEEYFRMFTNQHVISSKFKWQRSRWKNYCPVALTKGKLVKGRPEFAIGYLGKLYALSTKQAVKAFIENPRPYLLDPNPKIPCRIFITGPPNSGKTSLATKLASRYQATIIDMSVAIMPTLNQEKERARKKLTEEVIEEAVPEIRAFRVKTMLDSLQEQRNIRKLSAEMVRRQERTMERTIAGTLEPAVEIIEYEQISVETSAVEEKIKTITESSKTPETLKTSKTLETHKQIQTKKKLGKKVKKFEEITWASSIETLIVDKPVIYSDISSEDMDQEAKEREELIQLAELKLDEEIANEIEVEHDDPEVLKRVEEALLNSGIDDMFLDPETVASVLLDEVIIAEQNLKRFDTNGPDRGGWIIDNFQANSEEHWAEIFKIQRLIPDDIIRLVDTTENYMHLVHLWYNQNMSALNNRIVDRLKLEMLDNIRIKKKKVPTATLR